MLKQENVCSLMSFNLNLLNDLVCMTSIITIWKKKKKEEKKGEKKSICLSMLSSKTQKN